MTTTLLSSRNSRFYVNFPKGWIFSSIEKKYSQFLKKSPFPYSSINSYINACIQSISFPAIETTSVEQKGLNNRRFYKGGFDALMSTSREFTMTFKMTESFMSWFIMKDQLEEFYSYDQKLEFLPNVSLYLLDHFGNMTAGFIFKYVIYNRISGIDLSYSSDNPESKNFTCNFKYSQLEPINLLNA